MQRSEIIFEVVESPEGGYEAHALGESIFTEGETMEELRKNVREAVRCHFDRAEDRPALIRLHMVKDEVLSA
jgi:predicted RNase H-like HicB family nuclease